MPRAIFINDMGEQRSFAVRFTPVYILWRGRQWARQPGTQSPGEVATYRETSLMTLEQLALDDERVNV